MTRVLSTICIWLPALALMILGACSSDDDSPDAGSSPAMGAGGATFGTGGSPSSAAGVGGAKAGAGMMMGGTGGVTSGAGGAGPGTGGSGGSTTSDAGMTDGGDTGSGTRPAAVSLMLPTMMESGGVEPWFNIYRPTDLSATGERLPVIVWANGGCFRSDFTWEPLFNRWAAGGFVVLVLTEHPTDGALATTTEKEHQALIDWTVEQAEAGPYAGKLDTDRIIVSGNSCGGVTALTVASNNPDARAVFVLSGSSALGDSDKTIMGGISVPVGYIVGSPDEDVANGPANMDYDLLPEGVPAMVVNRATGDHVTVSTDETVLPQDAEIALNWMDLAVFGTKAAADALNSPNVCASCDPVWTLKSKNLEKLLQ